MAKTLTIFISYNPNSEKEQTLAVRLHSIAAVNGFRAYLPDRYNSNTLLDIDTKRRIDESDFFVIFFAGKVSKIVDQEIEYAYQKFNDKSRVIVLYDELKRTPSFNKPQQVTSIVFNSHKESLDGVISRVFKENSDTQTKNSLGTLLGVGLGLWFLSKVSNR